MMAHERALLTHRVISSMVRIVMLLRMTMTSRHQQLQQRTTQTTTAPTVTVMPRHSG